MPHLIGEYPCKVDAKGRVRLPNGLLKGLGPVKGESVEFVINRGLEKCLVLYPIESWELISDKVASLNGFNKEHRAFQRYFFQGAFTLALDAMERINIPKSLMEWAGIQSEVVLIGTMDRIEIWAKEAYDSNGTPENIADLADSIFGDAAMDKP